MWYHWMPMFQRSIGRVVIAFWLFVLVTIGVAVGWLYVIEPIVLPWVADLAVKLQVWVASALAYATERLSWLWSWLLAQF